MTSGTRYSPRREHRVKHDALRHVPAFSPLVLAERRLAKTVKPPLHGQHWVAVTGKPLAATAGAMIFGRAATRSTPRAR